MSPAAGGEPRRLRIGIAGTGRIVPAHVDAARRNGADVVALGGGDPERTRTVAGELGIEGSDRPDELVTRDDLDVIHVAGRNADHVPLALAALESGKHAVVEKPLAFTAEEAARLADAAASAGLLGATCFTYLGHPAVAEARHRIADGRLGPVVLVRGHYLQDWLALETDDDWRCDPAANGPTRALADIGTHWFSLLEHVTGQEAVAVRADLETVVPRAVGRLDGRADDRAEGRVDGGDDIALIGLRLSGGAVADCVISQISHGHANDVVIEVTGAAGSLTWSSEAADELVMAARTVDGRKRDTDSTPSDRPPLAALLAPFYAAVAGAEDAGWFPSLATGVRAAAFTDAALRSASSGRWVPIDPPAPDPG